MIRTDISPGEEEKEEEEVKKIYKNPIKNAKLCLKQILKIAEQLLILLSDIIINIKYYYNYSYHGLRMASASKY